MDGRPGRGPRPEHASRNRVPRMKGSRTDRFDGPIRGDEGDIRIAAKPFDLLRGEMRREALQSVRIAKVAPEAVRTLKGGRLSADVGDRTPVHDDVGGGPVLGAGITDEGTRRDDRRDGQCQQ